MTLTRPWRFLSAVSERQDVTSRDKQNAQFEGRGQDAPRVIPVLVVVLLLQHGHPAHVHDEGRDEHGACQPQRDFPRTPDERQKQGQADTMGTLDSLFNSTVSRNFRMPLPTSTHRGMLKSKQIATSTEADRKHQKQEKRKHLCCGAFHVICIAVAILPNILILASSLARCHKEM